jgi:hypothetical protein
VTCLLSQMTPADKVFMLHVEDKFGYKVMQLAIQLSDIRLTILLYHFFAVDSLGSVQIWLQSHSCLRQGP